MVFINLKKAYHRVVRDSIRWINEINKDIYEEAVISVKVTCEGIGEFLVTIDLHQGSSLSPYLFILITND